MTTMKDVALKANVSLKTVSRVINDEAGVSDPVREYVKSVIHDLGYVPNLSAQRLKRGTSRSIALVLPRVESPYAIKLLSAVLEKTRLQGYSVVLLEDNPAEKTDRDFIKRVILHGQADGLLIAPPGGDSPDLMSFVKLNNVPCVVITPRNIDDALFSVEATDYQGARDAVDYLIGLGHRKIAHIACLDDERFSHERSQGYQDAMAAHHLVIDPLLVCAADNSTESGRLHAQRLLETNNPPTAFFAGNDEMAAGVIMAVWQMGLRVPDDVSVVGFDDAPIAQQVYPGLTTVAQPIDDIASYSVSCLIQALEQKSLEPHHKQFATRLVLRESCAAVP